MEHKQFIEFKDTRFKRSVIGLIIIGLIGIITYIIYKEVFLLLFGVYAFSQFLVSTQHYKVTDEKIEFYSVIGHNNWKDIYLNDIVNIWVKNKAAIIEYQLPRADYSKTQRFSLTETEALRFQDELVKRNPEIDIQ